jgi:hypothetical protein
MIGRWQNRYDDARAAIAAENQILMFNQGLPSLYSRQAAA